MKAWRAVSNFTDGFFEFVWACGESMKKGSKSFLRGLRIGEEISERFLLHQALADAEAELKEKLTEIVKFDEFLNQTEYANVNKNFWFKDHLSKLAETLQNKEKGLE